MLDRPEQFSLAQVADILSVSKETLRRWDNSGFLVALRQDDNNYRYYARHQLENFEQARQLFDSNWDDEELTRPLKEYTSIEVFAGAGGLAIGLEEAGFKSLMLNDIDKDACATLKLNRPEWNVIQGSIADIDFAPWKDRVDLLSGGFPCQAFSYAGKKLGFEDTRGTLFFEFGRAIQEMRPRAFVAENVRGLLKHDAGRTLETIQAAISELGYTLIDPKVLKAVFFKVPQKRERLILVGIRNDLFERAKFRWPSPYHRILTLKDALKAGVLYDSDVEPSKGQQYPERKKEIMSLVPPGGYWRDLPLDLQKEYMKKSFFLGGGKTGMARRLSWDEPSLTLTCAPAQKQTERCHPSETRPLAVREYARVQTFPDDWQFAGALTSQYKQIGNAVPVNLASALSRALVRMFNSLE